MHDDESCDDGIVGKVWQEILDCCTSSEITFLALPFLFRLAAPLRIAGRLHSIDVMAMTAQMITCHSLGKSLGFVLLMLPIHYVNCAIIYFARLCITALCSNAFLTL